jgi:hypothetical protein
VQIKHLALARSLRRGRSTVGKVFESVEGWHGENLLFAHQSHSFFARLVSTITGGNAGLGKRGNGTEKRSQAKNNRSLACVH